MTVIEEYEAEAALGLIAEGIPLQELAAENIFVAIRSGIIELKTAQEERELLEASIKGGRTALEHAGITVG